MYYKIDNIDFHGLSNNINDIKKKYSNTVINDINIIPQENEEEEEEEEDNNDYNVKVLNLINF